MFSSRTDWPITPNRLSIELEQRRRQGLPVLDLTESNPTRCGFRYDAGKILGALADPRGLTYEPDPRGLLLARRAVAGYYAERGIQLDPEQIFLTTGTSEGYSYVFRLLADSGDNVLVPRPSYPLFDFLSRLDELELISYRLTYGAGWQIDLQSVAGAVTPRTRAILVVNPNNPTGSFAQPEELRFMAELCKERSLALVCDEVFADYAFAPGGREVGDGRHLLRQAAAREALTFTLSGLSKISALPQVKLAWVVVSGPADVLRSAVARLELIADTYLSVSGPLAGALPALLEVHRRLQPQILERVCSNLHSLDQRLSQPSPVSRLRTEGGWYVILKVPSNRSDEDWAIEILNRDGVLVHPGHFYDFVSEGHLVASLLPPPEAFEPGTAQILARVGRDG